MRYESCQSGFQGRACRKTFMQSLCKEKGFFLFFLFYQPDCSFQQHLPRKGVSLVSLTFTHPCPIHPKPAAREGPGSTQELHEHKPCSSASSSALEFEVMAQRTSRPQPLPAGGDTLISGTQQLLWHCMFCEALYSPAAKLICMLSLAAQRSCTYMKGEQPGTRFLSTA